MSDANDHHPGAGGTVGLHRPALLSGCRLRRISPVSSLCGGVMLASSLRLDVPAARYAGCRNGRHLPSRCCRVSEPQPPASRSRDDAPREAPSRRCTRSPRRRDRRASLEVCFPSAPAGPQCAVRGEPASGQSRCGVFSPVSTRASADLRERASPLRFSALRRRGGAARHADMILAFRRPFASPGGWRLAVLARCHVFDRPCGRRSANPTPGALTSDPSHQAPPLRFDPLP